MSTTQADSTAFEVPVIDISPYTGNGTAEDRARVADEMDRACSTVGFVQVLGHAVPDDVWRGLGEAVDDFFGQSLEEKKTYVAQGNRGYSPPKSESLSLSLGIEAASRMNDFFEAFNVGTEARSFAGLDLSEDDYGINVWPDLDGFRPKVEEYYAHAARVARVLTSLLGERVAPGRLVLGAALLTLVASALTALTTLAPLAYALVGLACGPIFPTTLAWAAQHLPARLLTLTLVGGSAGGILMPWLLGLGFAGLGAWAVPALLTLCGVLLSGLVLLPLNGRS